MAVIGYFERRAGLVNPVGAKGLQFPGRARILSGGGQKLGVPLLGQNRFLTNQVVLIL
jgi:hypothetical protein